MVSHGLPALENSLESSFYKEENGGREGEAFLLQTQADLSWSDVGESGSSGDLGIS